jgi:hypothetical protein
MSFEIEELTLVGNPDPVGLNNPRLGCVSGVSA